MRGEMKLSELYGHKADYEKMLAMLDAYKSLPCVSSAVCQLERALDKCKHFEKWHIDTPGWDDSIDRLDKVGIYTCCVSTVPNQRGEYTDEGFSTYPLELNPPQEFLKISFMCGAYMFGGDYPVALFKELYSSLKAKCPPKYEDEINNSLYYTPDDAASAYSTCMELCAKYQHRYSEGAKKRKIAALELELAQLKGESK